MSSAPFDPIVPRRLTPSEKLHELAMAYATKPSAPPEHAVEITRNAKGVKQWTITVRGYNLEQVLSEAERADSELETLYPYPQPDTATSE